MAAISFNSQWEPNNVPTDVASATIGIVDSTTNTTVVAPGTAMTHVQTGSYTYEYASAVAGHTYLGTSTLVATNGATGVFEQVIFVSPVAPGTNPPVTNSGQMVALLQQQLADVVAAKTAAIGAITTVLSIGAGPNYSISGRAGSESLDMTGFISAMREQVTGFAALEMTLLETIQNLSPFDIRQILAVRNRW